MALVSPSLLNVPAEKRAEEAKRLLTLGADLIHIDVMDGHFVPAVSFPLEEVQALLPFMKGKADAHLMVEHPLEIAKRFVEAGVSFLTFHVESCDKEESLSLLSYLKEHKVKAGISLRPGTDTKTLLPFLPFVDLVLVMSVEPGKGGQAFLPSALERISFLKKTSEEHGYSYLISVDGGIQEETSARAAAAGADILVAGTYLALSEEAKSRIERLHTL